MWKVSKKWKGKDLTPALNPAGKMLWSVIASLTPGIRQLPVTDTTMNSGSCQRVDEDSKLNWEQTYQQHNDPEHMSISTKKWPQKKQNKTKNTWKVTWKVMEYENKAHQLTFILHMKSIL